ncbi:uncharacterized protein LOC143735316 isoform X2 [Siphateles boraxobius]|uniref:uncharacterized protein LOC143735316 isoform X2 n=1 Tax=Siphateles boraxobius TaxID=180520 RepID=UPI004062CA9E
MARQEPKGSLLEGVFSETRSVKAGESITLHTGLTEIQKDEVMDWTFGAEQNLIARVRKDNIPTIYNDELNGKFKGRLNLDGLTGNLTISNMKTTDSGDYEVSNSINSFKKSISVSVSASVDPKPVPKPVPEPVPESAVPESGLSPGATAGIVIAVIAAAAAAVGGIAYGYWKKGQML